MKSSANFFQTIVLIVLGLAIFFAVMLFSGVIPGFRSTRGGAGGEVVLWSPIPTVQISETLKAFAEAHKDEFTLTYVEKDSRTLENSLVEALAAGTGPDLVIMPHSSIYKRRNNLIPFPTESYPVSDFKNTFARESLLYLNDRGISAFPLYLDPLVLYYNVDLLNGAQVVTVPKTWKDLEAVVKKASQIDSNKNITLSTIPLGKANNIANAKDIIALLAMQAGSPLTEYVVDGLRVALDDKSEQTKSPVGEALGFFNRFSNSANELYTWNGTLPEAQQAFIRGQAVMYIGRASEYQVLRRQNPQLNIDVDLVPQLSKLAPITLGQMMGVSLVRGAKNPVTAAKVATLLSGADFAGGVAASVGLPPVRADLLGVRPKDPVQEIFYQSAIFSRGWIDPDPTATKTIFQRMVESSQSGVANNSTAVSLAKAEMDQLLK